MFKASHIQEMKRRYAEMYAPPIEEEVEEKQEDVEEEQLDEHCGVCGEGEGIEEVKEVELDEVNLAKVSDDSLRKRMKQLRTGGKTDMPSIQFGIKQISK